MLRQLSALRRNSCAGANMSDPPREKNFGEPAWALPFIRKLARMMGGDVITLLSCKE